MNKDLFIEAMNVVYSVLKDAKMDKKFIDEVVLVGGSTRIPKVQTMLRELFGKEPNRGINPDEAVAFGAVMQAAVLSGLKNNKMELMVLLDVAPLSLGVETSGGIFSAVVKRNTTIPCQATKVYTTEEDNQTTVEFPVYEGERKLARDNHHLGTFSLTGLLPAKRGIPQLMVTFELNANSILSVTAVDKATGRSANIVISQRGTLSKTDVERMVLDAERYKNEDANNLKRAKLRNELDEFCYTISSAMDEFGAKVDGPLKKQAKAALEDCRQWLEEQGESATKNQLQARMSLLDAAWQPLVRQLYGAESAPPSRGSSSGGSGVGGSRHRQQQPAPAATAPTQMPTAYSPPTPTNTTPTPVPTPTPTPTTAPTPSPSTSQPQPQPTTSNNKRKTNKNKKNKNKGRKPGRH
ncbi:heat-shock protein 70 [Pelomyxa schiedti]|nr:heat-shock protein 70 [Pelomyxa schiedti]